MGGACCTSRDAVSDEHPPAQLWLKKTSRETAELRVVFCSARGFVTVAKRTFMPGDILIHELPIALLFPQNDSPWLADMRSELERQAPRRAWQFCLAAHCLAKADLPEFLPTMLRPLEDDEVDKVMELSVVAAAPDDGPSASAAIAARHIMHASSMLGEDAEELAAQEERLARRLDAVAARVAKHGFRVEDRTVKPRASADALYYRGSFVGACNGGCATAVWDFNGSRKTLTVTAVRMIHGGEEVTVDPASKPWLQRLDQDCSCSACCRTARGSRRAPAVDAKPSVLGHVVGDVAYASGSTEAGGTERYASELATAQEAQEFQEAEAQDAVERRRVLSARTKYGKMTTGSRLRMEEKPQRVAEEKPQQADAKAEAAAQDVTMSASLAGKPSLKLNLGGIGDAESPRGLAREWVEDYTKPLASPCSTAGLSSADTFNSPRVVCGSDDVRLERLLQRCACEGLQVTREEAESVLREEEGQVGKALLGVRRRFARASPRAST